MTDFKDELLSCDTLGVAAARSAYGCNLFAKNSDRPTGECQPLIWIPAADHEEGEPLDCSGFTIPQAAHTYGVLGSHPYWIYGFEMGINEHGVFIGNEAEFSRDLGKEPEDGLLGMDLLRLGLERGATAREAMEVIIDLTEKYGQNHNANPYGDGRYENSYLITDANEEWVLETAGRRHVARRIDGTFAVGNCYSIEDDFETASPDIEEYARENGWLLPYEKFQFAKAYTKPGPGLTISNPRRRRVQQLADRTNKHTIESLKAIFRDHHCDDALIMPRYNGMSGLFPTVCRHSLTLQASQTAATFIGGYRDVLGCVVRASFSQPCCSVFIPVYAGIELPECLTKGGRMYSEDSLWWRMDRMVKLISIDEERFAPALRAEAAALEERFEQRTLQAEEDAEELIRQNKKDEALGLLSALCRECTEEVSALAAKHTERVLSELKELGVDRLQGTMADFLAAYCERTGMPLL